MENLKTPQITETYCILTPDGELLQIAKRLTLYLSSGGEDFSFIKLNHSWVEMLPPETKLIKTPPSSSSKGIENIKDLLVARFIGEVNLSLPNFKKDNLSKIEIDIHHLKRVVKSFEIIK